MIQQPASLSLRRNFSWTMAGNLLYAGTQWGILVALTKLGSPEMVGQFTLGLAVTAPIFMFTNLNLRQIQATDAKGLYHFNDYLGLRLLCTLAALSTVMAVLGLFDYRFQTFVAVLSIGAAKGVESISDLCYGFLQQHERMDRIALSLMMRGPLALLALGIGVWLSGSVIGGIIGMVLAWGIVLLGYDLKNSARLLASSADASGGELEKTRQSQLKPNWSRNKLWPLAQLAFPLGLVMMLGSLSTNLPSYFIVVSLGKNAEAELGIFNAISYLMVAGNIVVTALGEAASPKLAKYYISGDRAAYRLLLLRLIGIGVAIGVMVVAVAIIGGGSLLSLLYSPAYAERQPLFVCLMAGSGLQYVASFLGYGMTAARYFRVQVPLLITSMVSLSVACLWLIPRLGLLGAAVALIISAAVRLLISGVIIVHAVLAQPIHAEA